MFKRMSDEISGLAKSEIKVIKRKQQSKDRRARLIGLKSVCLASQVLHGRAVLAAAAFMGCAFGFFCLAAYVHQVNRTHIIPYLVTVDAHGVVMSHGEVRRSEEIPSEVVAATLAGFISDLRQISSDPHVQKQAILKVYSHVKEADEAQHKLDAYYRGINPFEEGRKKRVEVQIQNVIAQGPQALQIDWNEKTLSGQEEKSRRLRAILSYRIDKVQDMDAQKLLLNPLSIYVSDFVISEVITGEAADVKGA